MSDKYTSQIALVLDEQVEDVGAVAQQAVSSGDIDRTAPVRSEGADAQEVHWGGRMQRAVVRRLVDEDGAPLLRTEAYIGGEGLKGGMRRQAQLLQALARQLSGRVREVRDLNSLATHDLAWVNRLAIGAVEQEDGIVTRSSGEGVWWTATYGAARFDVPDLELYGLRHSQVEAAEETIAHVHEQLLRGGMKAELSLPDGTLVYLVPVLEAWQHLNLDWPGVGRAGQSRGPALDGPRATLSVLHKPRFGRYRKDFAGVTERI